MINNKADCLAILEALDVRGKGLEGYYEEVDDCFTIFDDPEICMVNGGNTHITKIGKESFEVFSSGQNWEDQVSTKTSIQKCVNKLWRVRKVINKQYKELYNY